MEASAFKQRFMPYWRHLFWTAWRLTGNTQDAEDLVQEAFLKLWTKREQDRLQGIHHLEGRALPIHRGGHRSKLEGAHFGLRRV